jgi:hypothetical protein
VDARDVFPTESLLGHVPALIWKSVPTCAPERNSRLGTPEYILQRAQRRRRSPMDERRPDGELYSSERVGRE